MDDPDVDHIKEMTDQVVVNYYEDYPDGIDVDKVPIYNVTAKVVDYTEYVIDTNTSITKMFPLKAASEWATESIVGGNSCMHFLWDDDKGNVLLNWDRITFAEVDELIKFKVTLAKEDLVDADELIFDNQELQEGSGADIPSPAGDANGRLLARLRDGDAICAPPTESVWDEPGTTDDSKDTDGRVNHDDEALLAIVRDPQRFARARRHVKILNAVPLFDVATGKYYADEVDGVSTRFKSGTERPLHITTQVWAAASRGAGFFTKKDKEETRKVWVEEWQKAVQDNARAIIDSDNREQVAKRKLVKQASKRFSRIDSSNNTGADEAEDAASAVYHNFDWSDATTDVETDGESRSDLAIVTEERINRLLYSNEEYSIGDAREREKEWASRYQKGEIPIPYSGGPKPMPITTNAEGFEDGQYPFHMPFNCCVAMPVSKPEIHKLAAQGDTRALDAVNSEWKRLRNVPWPRRPEMKGTWEEDNPREYEDVRREALKKEESYHFGNVFNLCVLKGSELPDGAKGRKYKGRTVFQGNMCWDQDWDMAMFQELSSSPATMEASKTADAIGLQPGWETTIADADQAYTQSELGGDPTYVFLPKEQWPESWKKHDPPLEKPVCKLILSLYGHPNAGAYWEQHCDEHLKAIGFEPIDTNDAWRSCYHHKKYDAFLIVYVDDFKMSCKKEYTQELWKMVRENTYKENGEIKTQGIKLGDIDGHGQFLGCNHIESEKVSPITGKTVRTLTYDVSGQMLQAVDLYCELANFDKN